MLILGIILTISGMIVFRWMAKTMILPWSLRPHIFLNPNGVLIINLMWIGLLSGGFYSFWQVSPKIALFIILFIIGYSAMRLGIGYFHGYKIMAKNIFQIYKKLKFAIRKLKRRIFLGKQQSYIFIVAVGTKT